MGSLTVKGLPFLTSLPTSIVPPWPTAPKTLALRGLVGNASSLLPPHVDCGYGHAKDVPSQTALVKKKQAMKFADFVSITSCVAKDYSFAHHSYLI